jgi:hypothetical protein
MPSYATSLRAQIQPRNYRLLKDYYELLAKNQQLALLNKIQLLKESQQHNKPQMH